MAKKNTTESKKSDKPTQKKKAVAVPSKKTQQAAQVAKKEESNTPSTDMESKMEHTKTPLSEESSNNQATSGTDSQENTINTEVVKDPVAFNEMVFRDEDATRRYKAMNEEIKKQGLLEDKTPKVKSGSSTTNVVPNNPEPEEKDDGLEKLTLETTSGALLMECAWEVCNQVGGIYTVIQTKVPATKIKWGDNYLMIGPYFYDQAIAVFDHDKDLYNEHVKSDDETVEAIKEVVKIMHRMGYDVHYGTWLIDGRPKAILFNPQHQLSNVHEYKYKFWEHHQISLPADDKLLNQVMSFGFQVFEFIRLLAENQRRDKRLLAHFHEWMAGVPIPELRRFNTDVKIVFTTHATMLGRYLAMNDPEFYDHLPFYDWAKEAEHFAIKHIVEIERAASHGAHIFSTVSEITARECRHLIGRDPEAILPNGLNITRFEVMHEFQLIHKTSKSMINEFVMGHFFHNYTFNLDRTLYFFTSGRYEFYNKGFDLTLEALARLNWKMKSEGIDKTVVMFFITRNPYKGINASVLESRAKLEEIRRNVDDIQVLLSERLFNEMLQRDDINAMPDLNALVDDYLALRLRRNIRSWRDDQMPAIVTHDLANEIKDDIMNYLKKSHLLNYKEDKVKVVYHPDFVSTANPLFRMDYLQFVRGCHLGVFPSYYEPWGYTPLECCASGLPSITTDLSGFGSYVQAHIENPEEKGLYVVQRKNRSFDEVAEDLANKMLEFVKYERRDRITLRNRIEENASRFGWRQLRKFYDDAYTRTLNH
jgi:glycogen(starch) synthase